MTQKKRLENLSPLQEHTLNNSRSQLHTPEEFGPQCDQNSVFFLKNTMMERLKLKPFGIRVLYDMASPWLSFLLQLEPAVSIVLPFVAKDGFLWASKMEPSGALLAMNLLLVSISHTQKYSRLRCLLRVKGLVIGFYLG